MAVAAGLVAALAVQADRAAALTATPTMTPTPRVMEIQGRIFDASQGSAAGIAGARVDYAERGERFSLRTDAEGEFSFVLTVNDSAHVPVWVSKEGFVPELIAFRASDLRETGMIEIGLESGPSRIEASINGRVYDAAVGLERGVDGAHIHYEYNGSGIYPDSEGTLISDDNGLYGLLLDLGAGDSVDFTIEVVGFATLRRSINAFQLLASATMPFGHTDFGLAPLGGGLQIDPPDTTFTCRGEVDITISNVEPNETLVILGIELHHGYSQGDFGTGFSWDLSGFTFPIRLESGQEVVIPVSYIPADYASRLHVTVDSGARYQSGGGVYRSVLGEGCPSTPTPPATNTPTPTPTPFDNTQPPGRYAVSGEVERDPYCGAAPVIVVLEPASFAQQPRSLILPASNQFYFGEVPTGDYVLRAESECQPSYAPPETVHVRNDDVYRPLAFDRWCPPVLVTDVEAGPPGTNVNLRGRCYYIHSGGLAEIHFDDELIGSVRAGTIGDYNTPIRIPTDAEPGLHRIEARSGAGQLIGSAYFFVVGEAPVLCTGDCDGDGRVAIDELIVGVRLALGDAQGACDAFADVSAGSPTIADLVAAVGRALNGCA